MNATWTPRLLTDSGWKIFCELVGVRGVFVESAGRIVLGIDTLSSVFAVHRHKDRTEVILRGLNPGVGPESGLAAESG